MKRLFSFIITIIALSAIAYPFRVEIQTVVDTVFFPPCTRPITYSLGTFDSRFGVSRQYFLDAIKTAESMWEKALGKDLFSYQENDGSLKIHLVFDYRAAVTTKLAAIDTELKSDQSMYDSLRAKYDALKLRHIDLKSTYNTRLASFEQRNENYSDQVSYWNKRKDITKEIYDGIESERKALQTEAAQLQALQTDVNSTVNQLNELVPELNRLADSLNLKVDKYNTIDASRGESFEEGVYESDGFHQKIDIFEFSSHEKLVRVLAHELGHALGLDHVGDPKAVMYMLNEGTGEKLSADDIAAAKMRCGVK